jgi:hypothetical protein
VGGHWFSENVMLANRFSGVSTRGEKRKEVELPWGCSEGKWPWDVKPPPGAGRGT